MIVPGLGNLPCFACASDKRPLIRDWPNRAERIEPKPWWPLVGVLTGIAFDVIDLGLPWLEANRHLLQTRAHKTKRAWHFLFQPSGVSGSNDDRIAVGVDVRAKGNYCIWWPRQGLEVIDLPLSPWPEELLVNARSKAKVHSLSAHREETPRVGASMPRLWCHATLVRAVMPPLRYAMLSTSSPVGHASRSMVDGSANRGATRCSTSSPSRWVDR
jgi:hypothetical protein